MKLEYFTLRELLPPNVIEARGAAAIELMDPRILFDLDTLRGRMGVPMTVNDRLRHFRGFRTRQSNHYSPFSQHSLGRAIDSVSSLKPEAYHYEILTNPDTYVNISFLEIDISWLHIDCRHNWDGARIKCWSPNRGFVDPGEYLKELKIKK